MNPDQHPDFPGQDPQGPYGEPTAPAPNWGLKGAVAAAVIVVIVLAVGLGLVVRNRNADEVAAAGVAASSSRSVGTTTGTGPNIGGEVRSIPDPDHPGQTITLTVSTSTTAVTSPPTTPPTTTPVTVAPTTPPTTKAPTTTTSTTAPTTTTTKPDTTVKIGTFEVPKTVDCRIPSTAPNQIKLSWNAPNAVKVTISVDGDSDAIYDTHMGSTGSSMYPWTCPGPHTYTITAYAADNSRVFKKVTVTSIV